MKVINSNEVKIMNNKNILITGSAGFIGFHLAKKFLNNNYNVIGLDGMTNYYDVKLKYARHEYLKKFERFKGFEFMLEEFKELEKLILKFQPQFIIHLAAQAGVRYSLENPKSYLDSNIIGTFNILELSKKIKPLHLLIASTSSIYGSNTKIPFHEDDRTDHPLSFYAATKKSIEVMSHTYSYNFNLPITIFRFFTIYGPWGRPDMALFKFTKSIYSGKPINIYNYGKMKRDFTYIEDLIECLILISNKIPNEKDKNATAINSLKIAPYRVVNIGNEKPINLIEFINVLENKIGIKAKKNFVELQPGDVINTHSKNTLLKNLINYQPNTPIDTGIEKFLKWYKNFYM